MILCLRYLLRIAYLKPYANLGALAVQPQIGVIALFLLLFVGGLATGGYMLRISPTTRPRTLTSRTRMGSIVSFSGCSRT